MISWARREAGANRVPDLYSGGYSRSNLDPGDSSWQQRWLQAQRVLGLRRSIAW